jgi:predicted phosphodiesterase
MRIGILSDLYVDELGALPAPQQEPDVLILAGNIGQGMHGLEWAATTYRCPIIYVCGNYSYRDRDIDGLDAEMKERAWGTHVHVLQDESLVLRGVRFIGCTLWSDFDLFGDAQTAMRIAEDGSLDYYRIRDRIGRPIRPADTLARHRRDVRFLEAAVSESFDDGHTIVITHHAPSFKSIPPRFRDDRLMACYASNLDKLVKQADAMLWVHGGDHDAADYMLGGTRVVANPRGFQSGATREIAPFRRDYYVEI